jgi:hypothetical protein
LPLPRHALMIAVAASSVASAGVSLGIEAGPGYHARRSPWASRDGKAGGV